MACTKYRMTAAALLLGFGLAISMVLLSPKDLISESGFRKIKSGMTEADVEAILGGAAGDYRSRPTYGLRGHMIWGDTPLKTQKIWFGDDFTISVFFENTGHVIGATSGTTWHPDEPFQKRLRRWLRFN